jgi:hypothetical protein
MIECRYMKSSNLRRDIWYRKSGYWKNNFMGDYNE